ncbi:hypothetical protein [Thalassospira lohafexi]|uniref:Conjugal transfer protein TraM n=1 Tax=Thalassospira lohafexi TaxID=744227 RepID=A0A2N3L0J5_9PROT|nr:hypothetical protein [Thalassospira lohafexi]PKR56323.1 hypothetical protein COO92_21680 [Thalassospira lohafexi]
MASVLDEAPPPPLTMDSIEELRTHLWKVHQVNVEDGDPVLMIYTIHKVVLDEHRRLIDQHNRTLSGIIQAQAETFTTDVTSAIEDFKNEALTDAVRERLSAMQEAARLADTAQDRFRKMVKLISILTALNLVAVVFTLGVLTVLTI